MHSYIQQPNIVAMKLKFRLTFNALNVQGLENDQNYLLFKFSRGNQCTQVINQTPIPNNTPMNKVSTIPLDAAMTLKSSLYKENLEDKKFQIKTVSTQFESRDDLGWLMLVGSGPDLLDEA